MIENCKNCIHFDGSKHAKDERTKHAGICSKWSEIVFQKETCKQFFSKENLPEKDIFSPKPTLTQISLFN